MKTWAETRDLLIAAGIPAEQLPVEWEPGINLRGADLSGADLRGAHLSRADLRGAHLRRADLSGADLSGVYLRRADLRGADLRGAHLSGADLSEANLREADLRGADLRGANLRRANLREADLSEASGGFTTGYFGQHHAVAAGGYISIGCERRTYDKWLANAEAIGQKNGYTTDEIADYVEWIKLAVARQRRIEEATQ